jgi:hypothetical protein
MGRAVTNWLSPNPLGSRQYIVAVMNEVLYEGSSGPHALVFVKAMSKKGAEEAALAWFEKAHPNDYETYGYAGSWVGEVFDPGNKSKVHVIQETV